MRDSTDKFIYFAYGSNMYSCRLKERTPSATPLGIGYVPSRRLTFDKVSRDGSGKCDIESTTKQTDRVYGVLFKISSSEKSKLDAAEGLGRGYKEEQIRVVMMNGDTHDAIAYVATKKDPVLRPYHWYKALVIAGANEHKLPADYVEWLRTIESLHDPDAERRARHELLLFGNSLTPGTPEGRSVSVALAPRP